MQEGLTRYGYKNAISGFFEFPTENARRLLPRHLEPVELHHGTAVFSLTVFDFNESMVGSYGEVVASVICAPFLRPGAKLPKSAFFPYLVGTTTKAAREHAIERWHLPHYMEDMDIRMVQDGGRMTATVAAGGKPVADMVITEHSWQPVEHLYQAFTVGGDTPYIAHITMQGEQSEHQEETGKITLHEHPFNEGLSIADVYEVPFQELWMRNGMQTFQPLAVLETT